MAQRIAFITYALSGGGAEKNLLLLARYLRRKQYQVDIIVFKNRNDFPDWPESKNTISLSGNPGTTPFFLKPLVFIQAFIKLARLINKNHYGILLGLPNYLPYYAAASMARLYRIKYALSVENNIEEEICRLPPITRVIHRYLLNVVLGGADAVICKSHGLREMTEKLFHVRPQKAVVIANGLDLPLIAAKKKEPPDPRHRTLFSSRNIIVTAGRLEEQKNLMSLLVLFRELLLLNKQDAPKLCVFGKGTLLQQLQNEARRLNIEDAVFFLGHEKHNIYRYVRRSKMFIQTSLFEGFGIALAEALACGLPVISSDCRYGPREILSGSKDYKDKITGLAFHAYGCLIPARFDEKEAARLARSINKFLHDEKKLSLYKIRALQRAKDYSFERCGRLHLGLFNRLVNE